MRDSDAEVNRCQNTDVVVLDRNDSCDDDGWACGYSFTTAHVSPHDIWRNEQETYQESLAQIIDRTTIIECPVMIDRRYYRIGGQKWEARFFQKGERFPDTTIDVSRQGVWACPELQGWDQARFLGNSWRFVNLDIDVSYLPENR